MNCKLEKFWNAKGFFKKIPNLEMNCKLEKFWNSEWGVTLDTHNLWTVNLKSFEMFMILKITLKQKYEL